MKFIKPFNLNESSKDEAHDELVKLGLIDLGEFHDRFYTAFEEWENDQSVQSAVKLLETKVKQLIDKYHLKDDEPIDFEKPMANWESYLDKMADEPLDNIGLFDFLALTSES